MQTEITGKECKVTSQL